MNNDCLKELDNMYNKIDKINNNIKYLQSKITDNLSIKCKEIFYIIIYNLLYYMIILFNYYG